MKSVKEHLHEITEGSINVSLYPPLPEKLQVELNETCNHSCVFCPFHSRYLLEKPRYSVMKPELALSILKEASELGIGRKELGLFASGEPFLYSELGKVFREAKALKFPYVYLTTNGSLVTEERTEEDIDAGIDSIRFSINAGTRESYAEIHGRDDFDNVIRNLKYVNEYRKVKNKKINLSISFVQTKKNSR